jgi:inositol 1,4,5-triphosphate receptor type 1/inositol 1,4,5-triphosphate receptor type 3
MFRDTTLEEKYLLISKQRRWQLCSQLIIFTNAFLLGGNTRCQNSILQKLVADSSNSMLINIQQLIRKFSRYVCHTFKSRRGKKSNTTQKKYLILNHR